LFALQFLAKDNQGLEERLVENKTLGTIDKRELKKVRKESTEIDELYNHLEKEFFQHFREGEKEFIHGDASRVNFRSVNNRLCLSDFERAYLGKPQFSLWYVLASTIYSPEERKAEEEKFLQYAYAKRYCDGDESKVDKEEFDKFMDTYERIDAYLSMEHLIRLFKIRERNGEKTWDRYTNSIQATYQHIGNQLEKLE